MKEFLLVFFGGGLGSLFRFYAGQWIALRNTTPFPWGTLTINILACLILGVIISWADNKLTLTASTRLFWTVGFCGGFSTFSTFSAESIRLIQSNDTLQAIIYMFVSVVMCLLAVIAGLWLGKVI